MGIRRMGNVWGVSTMMSSVIQLATLLSGGEGGLSGHQLNGGVCWVGDSPVFLTQGFSDFSWLCSKVVIPKVILFYI